MILLIKAENENVAFSALKARGIDARFEVIVGGGCAKVIAPPQDDLERKVLKWFAEDTTYPKKAPFPDGALLWFRS
jgi:hypothetical protein